MAEQNPITKIEGLFADYGDEEVVLAKEYNGNVKALKGAIEHNGDILKTHAEKMKALSAGNIPEGGVSTDLIADSSVTEEKLSPEVRNTMLLTTETIASYFKDYLIQVHKHTPDIKGTFLNGSILDVNESFKTDLTYTKATALSINASIYNDDIEKYETKVITRNKYAPDSYYLCPYITGDCQWYSGTWDTKYTFNAPSIITATDRYSFTYKISYASKSVSITYNRASIKFSKVQAVKIDGTVVDLTEHFVQRTKDTSGHTVTENYKFTPKESFTPITDVIAIELRHSATITLGSSNFNYERCRGYVLEECAKDAAYSSTLQVTQVSAKMTYQGFSDSLGNLSRAHFSFRIIDEKGTERPINFSDTPLEVGVYCTAALVEGTELRAFDKYYPQEDFINCTLSEGTTYKATKVSDTEHFVEQTFYAPHCIIFDVLDTVQFTKFGTLHAGTYKLCYDAYNVDRAYIYSQNYSTCLESLYADCSDISKITNVRSAPFSIGSTSIKYKVSTNIMDVMLKDVCAVRY